MPEGTRAAARRAPDKTEERLRKEVQAAILNLQDATEGERVKIHARLNRATRRLTQYILGGDPRPD